MGALEWLLVWLATSLVAGPMIGTAIRRMSREH